MSVAKKVTVLAAFFLACTYLPAFEYTGVELHLGQAIILNGYRVDSAGDSVQGSDVSPIRFTAGAGARFRVNEAWFFSPSLRFFVQEYLLTESGKAVPTQIETGRQLGAIGGTLGLIVGLPFTWEYGLTDDVVFGLGASPSLLFRIPVVPIDGTEIGELRSYFVRAGRFLAPEFYGSVTYAVSDWAHAVLSIRTTVPVYNLWSEFDVPFWDELMIIPTLTIRIVPAQR
ncbi:MAG: hypothetical protein EA426_09650 [Spirochaetaceae bacterium]|nr:MAG: hypothetical protein EA426_09650 [Spirochaetaceae bacterium]